MPIYEWYEKIAQAAPFEQGDFFDNVPVLTLTHWYLDHTSENPVLQTMAERHNLVLMTQSCDLIKYRDADQVLLCPRLDYHLAEKQVPSLAGSGGWRSLIAGRVIGSHILNRCDIVEHYCDYQVVDLRRVFSIPMGFLREVASRENAKSRIRLLPPYREHLAQAFARQFMRVGLPIDLPREYPEEGK